MVIMLFYFYRYITDKYIIVLNISKQHFMLYNNSCVNAESQFI